MSYTNLLATAGQTLLEQFDIKTIFTILLLVFFAIIEIMRGVDYLRNKGKNKIKQLEQEEQRICTLEKLEQNNEDSIQQVKTDVEEIKQNVSLLIDSDKDDIRDCITDKYHYFMKLKYIDDFTLDCLERRFKSYKQEGGNTYVDSMMEELRRLPRKNLSDVE